jgi:hypothetical protein
MQNKSKYASLYRRCNDQEYKSAFAFFYFDSKNGETWETPFKKLAELADDEPWNFSTENLRNKYKNQEIPILTNYLNYTFMRLQDEGKIVFNEENSWACFNTGLQTKYGNDIFAIFSRNYNDNGDACDWYFQDFIKSNDDRMKFYPKSPELAEYIINPADLIFDYKLELEINYEHIIEDNIDRFPYQFKRNPMLIRNTLFGAVEAAKNMVRRNYHFSVPIWHKDKIQILMPLIMINPENQPDLAIVLDKQSVTDSGQQTFYIARTVLTMDQAYMNARLIASTGKEWLIP